MDLTGGVTAGDILWDLSGDGGGIVISSGADVDGTFLAPDRSITVDNGTILGAVIGGGGADSHSDYVEVHSSSEITEIPQSVPDGGATVALFGYFCWRSLFRFEPHFSG